MALRAEVFEAIGRGTAETTVTVRNVGKALTKAELLNNTALGRGMRDIHVSDHWIVSVFLGVIVNDLKNCISKVKACSLLRPGKPYFARYEYRNAMSTASFEEIRTTFPTERTPSAGGDNLLEELCDLANLLAMHWGSPSHQDMRQGFRLTINTGAAPCAELERFVSRDEVGAEWWIIFPFLPEHSQQEMLGGRAIARQAVITVEHLEMLAILWADTLRHEYPEDENIRAPLLHPIPELQEESVSSPKNENAAPGRTASTRDQDHNSIPGGDTPEARREKEKTQASSSCGSGRPFHSKRMTIDARNSRQPSLEHLSAA